MSDGPATLVILAFDKAGNVAGKYFNVMVSNNAPRLAKVYLGTDLNRDGEYSDNEFETYNIGAATGNTDGEETYELTTANFQKYSMKANLEWAPAAGTRTSFAIKNKLAILPEFVGGNGTMKLVFSNADSRTVTASDGTTSGDMTGNKGSTAAGTLLGASGTFTPTVEMVGVSNVSEEDRNSTDSIKNSLTAKSYWELTNLGSDTMTSSAAAATKKSMSFTFWDDTDECTQGDNSQYAFLRVKDFIVDQVDDIAPNVVVDPFKWEGAEAEKNNLYYATGSTTPLGHIELEGELPEDTFKTTNTGEYDRDPKVSGKIVIRGTAYDETLLGSLSFTMTNFKKAANATSDTVFAMATYQTKSATVENSGWSVESKSIDDDGYQITVEDVSIGQDGHKVNWSVAIDTSMLSDVAHTDAVFTVIANDKKTGTANSSANSTGTAAGTTDATKHRPTYQMDVVPYITGIKNKVGDAYGKDKSVFGRSAKGDYPVYYYDASNYETFTVNGFNFGSSPKVSVNGGTATTGNTVAVTSAMTSGGVVVTVGGVSSLNNVNNNDAKGSYTDSGSGYDKFKNYYNRQPNNINNSTLTDDCKVAVWNIDKVVEDTSVRYPTMRVGTGTGNPYVFIYDSSKGKTDGRSAAVMAYKSDFNDNNPFEIGYSFSQWFDTGAAIDKNGNIYGSAQNGDTGGTGNATYRGNYSNNIFFAKNEPSTWYNNYGYYPDNRTWAYSSTNYGYAIENGYYIKDGSGQFYANRVMNPKIVTDNNNNLYMTYYDSATQEVRFRYGTGPGNGGFTNHDADIRNNNGNITSYGTSSSAPDYHTLASGNNAGEYTAVGATTDGKAIVVYYNSDKQGLYYTYNPTPSNQNGWTDAVLIDDDFVGWYVDLVVDGANGVHIAYYDASNGDLKYAYVEDYTKPDEAKTMTVDSYLSSGTNISISVKKVGDDYVPYISSFMSSFNKTSYTVRTAWITDGSLLKTKTADELKGVDGDDFTGVWEVMTVPLASTSIPLDYSVGIGIKSTQPILGYGTQNGLETATMK